MNTVQHNTISISFVKEVVNTIDAFLHHGGRKKFESIEDAAQSMKSVWESLEFPQEEFASAEWQQVGVSVLDRIISGALKGFDAEEHLHGVNGMFNQSFRSAINVA